MIALAIVGIALVAILSLGNRSIATHERLQRVTEATLLAQQKMAETEVAARAGQLDRSRQEGSFAQPFANYRWRLEFVETPLPSIVEVTVTVRWGDEARNEAVDVTSFLF